jgi:hypothetical protein
MQAIPVIAGILLLGLVTLSGFQIVPESALSGGSTNSLSGGGVQIDTNVIKRAPVSGLLSGSLTQVDPVITVVSIKSAQDIERNTATLRGRIVVGPEVLGAAFFVYGYRQSDVVTLTQRSTSYEQLLEDLTRGVQAKRVVSNTRRTGDVSTRIGSLTVEADYYVQLCVELETRLRCSTVADFTSLDGPNQSGDVRIPTVRVDDQLISGSKIELTIDVNMRDTNDGRVYVVYGKSPSEVADAREEDYGDIDKNREWLQKERVAVNLIGSQKLVESIGDLDDETMYYYAVCVSYDGLRDGVVCTRVYSLTTPDDSFGDSPRVTTAAASVSGTTIALQGSVTMRSFRNGQVFFVYGTDENTIQGVEGQRQMTSIRQNSDRLQRVLVDNDVVSSDSFRVVVDDLRFSTAYVARLCIEFENEDERGRDRLYVECGEAQGFTTR